MRRGDKQIGSRMIKAPHEQEESASDEDMTTASILEYFATVAIPESNVRGCIP